MISFQTIIKRFDRQGEKTGWTFIDIPASVASQLKPGVKTSFKVKGKLDQHQIESVSILPVGEGDFIMPLNAALRKAIGKGKGAALDVKLAVDESAYTFSAELMECLADEPLALRNFKKQPLSHQKYFNAWIESAKTEATKAKRIANTINAMLKGMDYGEMIRSLRNYEL